MAAKSLLKVNINIPFSAITLMSWYNKFPAACEYGVPVNLTYKMAEVIPLVLEVNAHCDRRGPEFRKRLH